LTWLDELQSWLTRFDESKRPVFRRNIRLSGPVVAWLRSPGVSPAQVEAFAELLLKLDANPFCEGSHAILREDAPGLRWAKFDGHAAIYQVDGAKDQVRIAKCV
jgi:hypothetical protein